MSKCKQNFGPKIIKGGIVSVRQTLSGRGSTLRVFVDTLLLKYYAEACSSKYSTLSDDQRKTPWCAHLVEGLQASNVLRYVLLILLFHDIVLGSFVCGRIKNFVRFTGGTYIG